MTVSHFWLWCAPSEFDARRQSQAVLVTADPQIDAWMLATGRGRMVFRVQEFVRQFSDILDDLRRLRIMLNVLVLKSRCLVARALAAKTHDGEKEDNRSEVPSQTFLTTFES